MLRTGIPRSRNCSISGKNVTKDPIAVINKPITRITPESARAPSTALTASTLNLLNITVTAEKASNKIESDNTVPRDTFIFNISSSFRINPKSAVMTTMTPNPRIASFPIDFDSPMSFIDALNTIISIDKAPAFCKALSTSSLSIAKSIPASNVTIPAIISIVPAAFFAAGAHFSIIANDNINAERAAVEVANFFPSINDNAATAPAITAIATAITIRFPFTSFAPFVA